MTPHRWGFPNGALAPLASKEAQLRDRLTTYAPLRITIT